MDALGFRDTPAPQQGAPFWQRLKVQPPRACQYRDCNRMIEKPHHNQKFCEDCQEKANLERSRRAYLSQVYTPDQVDDILNQTPSQLPRLYTDLPGEEWRPVLGYEYHYEISSMGRLASIWRRRPRLIKGERATHGLRVELMRGEGKEGSRRTTIHRLVMEAFAPRKGMERCHIVHMNRDLSDNRLENLEWIPLEEKRHSAKLTPDDVRSIRALASQGFSLTEIAPQFNIHPTTALGVVRGDLWATIS